MKRTALVFGAIAGGIILVYSLIVFAAFGDIASLTPDQFSMMEIFGYLRYIILLLAVGIGMHTFVRQNGSPAYGKRVQAGLLVAVVIAGLVGLMEFGYILLNPNFYEEYGRLYINMLRQSGASEQVIKKAVTDMNSMKWMQNPVGTGLFYFVETAVIGLVGALIAATFIRSRNTAVVTQ